MSFSTSLHRQIHHQHHPPFPLFSSWTTWTWWSIQCGRCGQWIGWCPARNPLECLGAPSSLAAQAQPCDVWNSKKPSDLYQVSFIFFGEDKGVFNCRTFTVVERLSWVIFEWYISRICACFLNSDFCYQFLLAFRRSWGKGLCRWTAYLCHPCWQFNEMLGLGFLWTAGQWCYWQHWRWTWWVTGWKMVGFWNSCFFIGFFNQKHMQVRWAMKIGIQYREDIFRRV